MLTENRIFKYALITSIAAHIFLLIVIWLTNIEFQKEVEKKIVEVVYQSEVVEVKKTQDNQHVKSLKQKKKISLPKIFRKSKSVRPGDPIQPSDKKPIKLDFPKKSSTFKEFHGKRQIKIPMLDSDKMMGSRYMSYHEQVRDKIRNRAYFYVDDPDFESGEVYLTFVLASNGELKQLKIINDKTSANEYLRSVGLRSIKESIPFPRFPRDLDYPELTFNVVISFEVGE